MTNISILKLSGAFHWVKTSRIRFWAFSYSIGDPCERSFQVTTYFIGMLQYWFELKFFRRRTARRAPQPGVALGAWLRSLSAGLRYQRRSSASLADPSRRSPRPGRSRSDREKRC